MRWNREAKGKTPSSRFAPLSAISPSPNFHDDIVSRCRILSFRILPSTPHTFQYIKPIHDLLHIRQIGKSLYRFYRFLLDGNGWAAIPRDLGCLQIGFAATMAGPRNLAPTGR
jgi:hypothetical protein